MCELLQYQIGTRQKDEDNLIFKDFLYFALLSQINFQDYSLQKLRYTILYYTNLLKGKYTDIFDLLFFSSS